MTVRADDGGRRGLRLRGQHRAGRRQRARDDEEQRAFGWYASWACGGNCRTGDAIGPCSAAESARRAPLDRATPSESALEPDARADLELPRESAAGQRGRDEECAGVAAAQIVAPTLTTASGCVRRLKPASCAARRLTGASASRLPSPQRVADGVAALRVAERRRVFGAGLQQQLR